MRYNNSNYYMHAWTSAEWGRVELCPCPPHAVIEALFKKCTSLFHATWSINSRRTLPFCICKRERTMPQPTLDFAVVVHWKDALIDLKRARDLFKVSFIIFFFSVVPYVTIFGRRLSSILETCPAQRRCVSRSMASVAPPGRLHLPPVAPPGRLHLPPVAPPGRLHLPPVAPPGRLHLPPVAPPRG